MNTFSPEGRLFQVEYAIEAIKVTTRMMRSVDHILEEVVLQLGSTAVGICTSEGVVLAVEKRVTSTLMEPSSIEKILEIDSHIGQFGESGEGSPHLINSKEVRHASRNANSVCPFLH